MRRANEMPGLSLDSTPASDRDRQPRRRRVLLAVTAIGLIVLVIALISRIPVAEWLRAVRQQADVLGIWAPVAIIGLFYLFTLAALPTPLFMAASGATLGLWGGFFAIWLGYLLAAATVWAASRRLAKPFRARFVRLHPDAGPLLAAIARRGGWLVFLTQLHPLSPNGVLNWLYRSLGVKARHALPAIGLGRAPTLWLYTALGAWSVEGLSAQHSGWWWLASGLVAIAIFAAIGRVVTRALHEAMCRQPETALR